MNVNKAKTRRKMTSYHNQRVTNATHHTHKVENKERLWLCRIENLGPRGSITKLFELKRN